jgi:hypothetical protein
MQTTGENYVVLWSPRQRLFHIETVSDMLKNNLRIYKQQTLGDYILVSFAKDFEQASEIADRFRGMHKTSEDAGEED